MKYGLAAALLLALAPLASFGDTITFRGQEIEYGGASEVELWLS